MIVYEGTCWSNLVGTGGGIMGTVAMDASMDSAFSVEAVGQILEFLHVSTDWALVEYGSKTDVSEEKNAL